MKCVNAEGKEQKFNLGSFYRILESNSFQKGGILYDTAQSFHSHLLQNLSSNNNAKTITSWIFSPDSKMLNEKVEQHDI